MTKDEQQELWKVNKKFVRILFSSIDDGDMKLMGMNAFGILAVIRRYTPLSGVYSFPSVAKLAEKTGLSKPTVRKALRKLVELKYLEEMPESTLSKSNVYKVNEQYIGEKISLNPEQVPQKARLRADYNISKQKKISEMISHFEQHGYLPANQSLVHIETINVHQYNLADGSTLNQITMTPSDEAIRQSIIEEAGDTSIGRILLRAYESQKKEVIDIALNKTKEADGDGPGDSEK